MILPWISNLYFRLQIRPVIFSANCMYVSDHQNSRLGIYGMVIPINADSLTVTLLDVSNESLALIKIVGKVHKVYFIIL